MPVASTPKRKYALTRVTTGDYLLPSNDAKTIWRVARYTDGPSNGLEDMPADREFWGLWKWTDPMHTGGYVDTLVWDRWEMWDSLFPKRADAIDAALRAA